MKLKQMMWILLGWGPCILNCLNADDKSYREGFESMGTFIVSKGYACEHVAAQLLKVNQNEGNACLEVEWKSANKDCGVMKVFFEVPKMRADKKCFQFWIQPLDENSTGFGIELLDESKRMIEEQRVFHAKPNQWNKMSFEYHKKTPGVWMRRDEASTELEAVSYIVIRAHSQKPGQTSKILLDDFEIYSID